MHPPSLLYSSTSALVVDKPAGLPVYAGRAGGASVESFFPHWRQGKNGPWAVHRLDQDTSGCLLIARKKSFLVEAQALMAQGNAEKLYWALVQGVPEGMQGRIDAPLTKVTRGHHWRMEVDPQGDAASTLWRVLGSVNQTTLIEFTLLTGRTHQIRAHAAHWGHPVLADPVYGQAGGMMCLMARSLRLPAATPIFAQAQPPGHMRVMVEKCLSGL